MYVRYVRVPNDIDLPCIVSRLLSLGLAPEFWSELSARTLTGVGEASFACLGPVRE